MKAVSTPGSAYETFPGVSSEEATAKGLIIVEHIYSGGSPVPVYGRYKDALVDQLEAEPKPAAK